MTDAEKITEYDQLVELLKDRVALEIHYRKTGMAYDTIQQVRTDAYEAIVHLVLGVDALKTIRD